MTPLISVVVNTYNRAHRVVGAVESVLSLGHLAPLEVIVVDDGSDVECRAAIDGLEGPSVTTVRQPNLGLGAARVLGAATSTGKWLAFLDDDDRLLSGWSELIELIRRNPDAGIVSGSARFVDAAEQHIRDYEPTDLGPIFSNLTLQFLAGSFVLRRDVYEASGGYLAGLSGSHQYELLIRCAASARRAGLRVLHCRTPVVAIEHAHVTQRPLSNPRLSLDSTRWVLARHAALFELDPLERSNWEGVAAVNAVRLGESGAVPHAWRAARSHPRDIRRWARVAIAATSRGSGRYGSTRSFAEPAAHQQNSLAHAASFWGTTFARLGTPSDHLFLPWNYQENPPASGDSEGSPFWARGYAGTDLRAQDPMYRWAGRLVRAGASRVVDVGCGTGHKLVRRVAPHADFWVGVDQHSAMELARHEFPTGHWHEADLSIDTSWDPIVDMRPDLVICSDVIEHVVDPLGMLKGLLRTVGESGRLLLSTPDRSRLEGLNDDLGPPLNPRHIREWNESELRLLLEAAGFEVLQVRHLLPRAYSPTGTDLRRTVYRAVHRSAVPDRRSCMAFLLRKSRRASTREAQIEPDSPVAPER